MIGEGHGTRQIAEELHISVKTVESYQAHIKDKLSLEKLPANWCNARFSGRSLADVELYTGGYIGESLMRFRSWFPRTLNRFAPLEKLCALAVQ